MKRKELMIQIFKFVIVGGIATVIDWLIYFILYNLCSINPLIANIISFSISVIYNYLASVKWVFKVNNSKTKKQLFSEFMLFSILGLLLTEFLLWLFIAKLNIGGLVAKVISTAIVMVFNFVTRKIFLEKNLDFKKMLSRKEVTKILMIFYALCFTIGLNYYFFKKSVFGRQSILNFLILFLVYKFLNNNKVNSQEKEPLIFSYILATTLVIGQVIFDSNDISNLWSSWKTLFLNIITWLGFLKVFAQAFSLIFAKLKKMETKKQPKLWKFYRLKNIYLILVGILVSSKIPVFLAYFPGIYACDINVQTNQIFTNSISKWHPPIHTYFWQFCLYLSTKINIDALIIYSWLQIIFLSLVFAKICHFLIKKEANNWVILFAIIFFACNPVIHIYSLVTTKDVIFAGFMLLFILEIISLLTDPQEYLKKPFNWFKYLFFGIMACLFRNNAIYAIILSAPFLILISKKYWRQILAMFILIFLGYLSIQNGIYNFLGVKEGNNKEMLSVPIEQIANVVYHNDSNLTDTEKAEIKQFLSYETALKKYNPRLADNVKGTFNTTYFNNHKIAFLKLWTSLLVKYPLNYVSAFLSLSLNYWYLDANTLDSYTKKGYLEDYFYENEYYQTKRESKIPWLYQQYHQVANYKLFEKMPFISRLFSVNLIFWLLLFTIFVLWHQKQMKLLISILPLFFIWLTHMAGPISSFRYLFSLYCAYPLFIAFIFNSNRIFPKAK